VVVVALGKSGKGILRFANARFSHDNNAELKK
jgi:hypothetical protein